METIDLRFGWRKEAEKIGIDWLTGEADGTNFGRGLCDINEHGAELLMEYFRMQVVLPDMNGRGAIGRVMLTPQDIKSLIYFHHVMHGRIVAEMKIKYNPETFEVPNPAVFENGNELREWLAEHEHFEVTRVYDRMFNGKENDDVNQTHAMWGTRG